MKRTSLTTIGRKVAKGQSEPTTAGPSATGEKPLTTGIHLPPAMLELLRLVAIKRATRAGAGRPSVSAVIQSRVEAARADLEREAE